MTTGTSVLRMVFVLMVSVAWGFNGLCLLVWIDYCVVWLVKVLVSRFSMVFMSVVMTMGAAMGAAMGLAIGLARVGLLGCCC